jgi:hypothetical protein
MIFLSYAKEDANAVQTVYRELRAAGVSPWMDQPPPPWELEGIRPGEDWDAVIRQRLADADLVLAFLSRKSIAKRGYIQREYRLALDLAAERPAGSVFLIPILLEQCEPPDLRVGPVGLRQLQWFRLFESGMPTLLRYLTGLLSETKSTTLQPAESREHSLTQSDVISLSRVISAIKPTSKFPHRPGPWDLFWSACAALEDGVSDRTWRGWGYAGNDNEISIQDATTALFSISDARVATAAAATAARYLPWPSNPYSGSVATCLQSWLGHAVPAVRAVAAMLLAEPTTSPGEVTAALESYGDHPERIPGIGAVLREFARHDVLETIARTSPRLLWEIIANDAHFGGLGQRHVGRGLRGAIRILIKHRDWRGREVGVGILCADDDVPFEEKYIFLSDPEPRVRFRALEGILQGLDTALPLLDGLVKGDIVHCETRTWVVGQIADSPQILLVSCLDSVTGQPREPTGSFGNTRVGFDVHEFLDARNGALNGCAVLYYSPAIQDNFEGERLTYLDLEEEVNRMMGKRSVHWAQLAASRAGLRRVSEVRNLYNRRPGAAQQGDATDGASRRS